MGQVGHVTWEFYFILLLCPSIYSSFYFCLTFLQFLNFSSSEKVLSFIFLNSMAFSPQTYQTSIFKAEKECLLSSTISIHFSEIFGTISHCHKKFYSRQKFPSKLLRNLGSKRNVLPSIVAIIITLHFCSLCTFRTHQILMFYEVCLIILYDQKL